MNYCELRSHTLEKGMATHSRILAWRTPWTEEHGRLQSMGLHRVGHDWSDLAQHILRSHTEQQYSKLFSLLVLLKWSNKLPLYTWPPWNLCTREWPGLHSQVPFTESMGSRKHPLLPTPRYVSNITHSWSLLLLSHTDPSGSSCQRYWEPPSRLALLDNTCSSSQPNPSAWPSSLQTRESCRTWVPGSHSLEVTWI